MFQRQSSVQTAAAPRVAMPGTANSKTRGLGAGGENTLHETNRSDSLRRCTRAYTAIWGRGGKNKYWFDDSASPNPPPRQKIRSQFLTRVREATRSEKSGIILSFGSLPLPRFAGTTVWPVTSSPMESLK